MEKIKLSQIPYPVVHCGNGSLHTLYYMPLPDITPAGYLQACCKYSCLFGIFFRKFHDVHASPPNYGLTEVVLVNNMIHFEHIKSTQHVLPLYFVRIVVFTNRVPRDGF